MVNFKQQSDLLKAIGKTLKEKTECVLLGGSAMMFYDAKTATKDIDVAFTDKKSYSRFKEILYKMGFKDKVFKYLHGEFAKRKPLILQTKNITIDLFFKEVICFEISKTMLSRIKEIHEFGNLVVKIIAPEDIILLKCATERAGDRIDAAELIKKFNINWEIIIEESKNQIKEGEAIFPVFLHEFLFELQEDFKTKIPKTILTKLRKISEKEMIKALKKGSYIKEEHF